MKVAFVVDRSGIPLGVATDAAGVPETVVGPAAVASIPAGVPLRWGIPLVADRAYDSDELRAEMRGRGFTLIAPHRSGRKRRRTSDGRRLRRYRRRWIVERTLAWLHCFRRVVILFLPRGAVSAYYPYYRGGTLRGVPRRFRDPGDGGRKHRNAGVLAGNWGIVQRAKKR